jgi:hypothetical protein
MSWYIRNISANYAWVLKNQLGPGDSLNLDKVFEGFCKPKRSSRGETPKFSEFKEGEFEDFLEWVREEILNDKGILELVDDSKEPEIEEVVDNKKVPRHVAKAVKPKGDIKVRVDVEELQEKGRVTHKKIGKKLPSESEMSPKDIAWLPYDNTSKRIIGDIDDTRRLKTAFRLVRNISGQERTRKMIEDRLSELATEGR